MTQQLLMQLELVHLKDASEDIMMVKKNRQVMRELQLVLQDTILTQLIHQLYQVTVQQRIQQNMVLNLDTVKENITTNVLRHKVVEVLHQVVE